MLKVIGFSKYFPYDTKIPAKKLCEWNECKLREPRIESTSSAVIGGRLSTCTYHKRLSLHSIAYHKQI